jgi:SAM-dependent MidA family methyltransferase
MISIAQNYTKRYYNETDDTMSAIMTQKMTFAEHMERVLYGPGGYYSAGHAASGREGDYFTAPDVGPIFGRLLAAIFLGWQRRLSFTPFHLVEVGAGEGALAQGIGKGLQGHFPDRSLEFPYVAIERSPVRQVILRKSAAAFSAPFKVMSDIKELSNQPVSGCLFANELLDAFPVHRIRMHNGRLEEAFVAESANIVWAEPSTPRLAAYLSRIHAALPDGYETEINLAMADWFKIAAWALTRGLVLLVDYGRPAHAYYAPERSGGTLRAFSRHQVLDVIPADAGPPHDGVHVDLTADVDFTSAALDARAAGFTPLAYMELGSFLVEGARALSASPSPFSLAGLQYLIHPDGMGSAFQVLILGKGLPELTAKDFPNNRLGRLGLE